LTKALQDGIIGTSKRGADHNEEVQGHQVRAHRHQLHSRAGRGDRQGRGHGHGPAGEAGRDRRAGRGPARGGPGALGRVIAPAFCFGRSPLGVATGFRVLNLG